MLSIIIPVYNEALHIEKLLRWLVSVSSEENIAEIIVVDGGSTDSTFDKVGSFIKDSNRKILLISSEKGRARQMNFGAKHATASTLYFLHADSFPPKDFDRLILSELKKGNQAGCFRMKFDSSHWWLRLAGWLTRFKSKACRGGDQSQFITKALFNEIGGYDESYTIFEDYVLINQLYQRNEFVVIPQWLTTSARLYERKGIWRVQYHFWMIYAKKFFGATADDLYTYYRTKVQS